MPGPWRDIPLQTKLFLNVDETVLTRAQAAIENAFQNEAGGHSRFPGLIDFAALPDNGRVYVHEWRGDLIAVTSNGRVYRIDRAGNVEDVTGVPVSGGGRVIFAKTTDELVMAAGGPLIRFAGVPGKTELLSEDAPDSTHVVFIDNFLVAVEKDSGRFQHAAAGQFRSWNPLDVFSADGKPDDVNSAIATPFRELLLAGNDSLEQFERLPSGTTPFFRRWAVGEGVSEPYMLTFADNALWTVNQLREIVRISGQTSQPVGRDLGRVLESVDDWSDAWAGGYPDKPLHLLGQKFVLFQIPNATNPYDTKGFTFLYDFAQKRWTTLYGWDANLNRPTRWPGWSYWPLHDRVYVGCEGKVCVFDENTFSNSGEIQRMLGRTAHFSELGEIRIDNLRVRMKRGEGTNTEAGELNLRVRRDHHAWTPWRRKSFGKSGEREPVREYGGFGCGHTFQFEWFVTDDVPVEVMKLQAQVTQLGSQ